MPKPSDKLTLNDQNIKALPTAETGKRYDVWDAVLPGFGVRVTDNGSKSFILSAKLPGDSKTSRLTIGKVGKLGLAMARTTARKWLEQIDSGDHPKVTEQQHKLAKVKEAEDAVGQTFRAIATIYSATKLNDLTTKTRGEVIRNIEVHFTSRFGDRPLASITTREISGVITALAAKFPGAARTALSHIKTFFNWAANAGYTPGSVAAAINANKLLGKPKKGKRVLTDPELKAVWDVALGLPYPLGPVYLMLILTGCRLSEIVDGHRDEIDRAQRIWTIPAERMKKDTPHVLPLTDMMLAVLDRLPRFNEGGYLFSKTNGVTPMAWLQNDKDMVSRLAGFADWVNHDLRRTMRTLISPKTMGIPFEIRERMLAHEIGGVVDHYDLYEHLDEKRDGFERWNAKVAEITGGLPKAGARLKLAA